MFSASLAYLNMFFCHYLLYEILFIFFILSYTSLYPFVHLLLPSLSSSQQSCGVHSIKMWPSTNRSGLAEIMRLLNNHFTCPCTNKLQSLGLHGASEFELWECVWSWVNLQVLHICSALTQGSTRLMKTGSKYIHLDGRGTELWIMTAWLADNHLLTCLTHSWTVCPTVWLLLSTLLSDSPICCHEPGCLHHYSFQSISGGFTVSVCACLLLTLTLTALPFPSPVSVFFCFFFVCLFNLLLVFLIPYLHWPTFPM